MPNSKKETKEKLLQLMQAALSHDRELREKYSIGDKFRFIRDRLQALHQHMVENLIAIEKAMESKSNLVAEDEVLVYVYLFNAQGLTLKSWQTLLNPAVFYEFSVNRPIYAEKSSVESLIKNKLNQSQHGYLTIVIKQEDILTPATESTPLIKVKEGSLKANKLISFTHAGKQYILDEVEGLVKKKDDSDIPMVE